MDDSEALRDRLISLPTEIILRIFLIGKINLSSLCKELVCNVPSIIIIYNQDKEYWKPLLESLLQRKIPRTLDHMTYKDTVSMVISCSGHSRVNSISLGLEDGAMVTDNVSCLKFVREIIGQKISSYATMVLASGEGSHKIFKYCVDNAYTDTNFYSYCRDIIENLARSGKGKEIAELIVSDSRFIITSNFLEHMGVICPDVFRLFITACEVWYQLDTFDRTGFIIYMCSYREDDEKGNNRKIQLADSIIGTVKLSDEDIDTILRHCIRTNFIEILDLLIAKNIEIDKRRAADIVYDVLLDVDDSDLGEDNETNKRRAIITKRYMDSMDEDHLMTIFALSYYSNNTNIYDVLYPRVRDILSKTSDNPTVNRDRAREIIQNNI